MRKLCLIALGIGLLIGILGVSAQDDETPIRFAVIGDYGRASDSAAAVAEMVLSWEPDFIITTGDNNYSHGEASTIDQNIGQYYHSYIYPYFGDYGEGAEDETNRFFPSLGNHDWEAAGAQPYLDYFTLPGNERYYDFVEGAVHLFAVDADFSEPDGIDSISVQAEWLRDSLAESDSQWQIVYMHMPPYSSAQHGSAEIMQWDYQEWGADAVLAGHDHTYERIMIDGFPYFVNGTGGNSLYDFNTPVAGSEVRYNQDFGAMLVEATEDYITFEFYSIFEGGTLIDSYTIQARDTSE
jgi:hypothetical protein